MIQQLNPPIPVITPKGKALAHAIIDYGIEHDMQWLCFQDSTGESWTWANPQVRAQINITHGRDYISPFYHPSEVALKRKEQDEKIQDEEFEEEREEGSEEKIEIRMDYYQLFIDEREKRLNLKEAFEEKSEDLRACTLTVIAKNSKIEELKNFIKDLIKNDHILPDRIEWVLKKYRNLG